MRKGRLVAPRGVELGLLHVGRDVQQSAPIEARHLVGGGRRRLLSVAFASLRHWHEFATTKETRSVGT